MSEEKNIMIKAPNPLEESSKLSIFLAGSIEMGKAEDWQQRIFDSLDAKNLVVYNPRRENWDPSITQSIHDPIFSEQVNWELEAIENADIIFVRLLKDTISPISLLELGYSYRRKTIVCVDPSYFRKANIEIFCKRNLIPFYESEDSAIKALNSMIDINQNFKSLS